jgi:colicin import membrane protein
MNKAVLVHEFAPPIGKDANTSSVLFSIVVHLLLVAALTWGVSWNYHQPQTMEAELWQSLPQLAAPKLEEAPIERPTPSPVPEEKAPPPKPINNAQAIREAQIATARLKKIEEEQLEKDRQERILLENERLKKEKAEKEKEKAEKEKADKEKLEKERLKKEKLEKEKLEKEKADKDKKAKEKLEATKAEKDAQRKQEEDKKTEAIRQESLKRVNGMLGASGAPNATGTALHSAGPSASYAGRLKGRVKPNIIYPEISVSENPSAEVLVKLAPDGTIVSKKLTKPSGNSAWDTAVLKAIDKTEKFPRDTDGSVPSEIVFTFTPNE